MEYCIEGVIISLVWLEYWCIVGGRWEEGLKRWVGFRLGRGLKVFLFLRKVWEVLKGVK